MSDEEIVISVQHVSKDFKLPHQKLGSVKNGFTNMFSMGNRSFEVQHALKDINFTVSKGEFFGIVGRNGSGKSTLLKILAGIYQPTKGSVRVDGRVVPFIELGVGFNGDLTGRENVYLNGALLGFSEKEINAKYQDIVDFAELERFMDQRLKNYSSGMQVRLAFSVATRLAESDVLLIDEVLAVGDASFQRKCFSYFKELKANNKTVVFVTHDMNSVKEYCDRAMLIDNNKVKAIGDPQDIAREYAFLFMNNTANGANKTKQRWGNEEVKIKEAKAYVNKDRVVVSVKAEARNKIDKLIYGIHITGEDGAEITAMNNRMINAPDIKNIQEGEEVEFKWSMLNIFNDGNYSVTLTLNDDLNNELDWYVGATNFVVKKEQRSTTAVLPPLEVSHSVKKKRS